MGIQPLQYVGGAITQSLLLLKDLKAALLKLPPQTANGKIGM